MQGCPWKTLGLTVILFSLSISVFPPCSPLLATSSCKPGKTLRGIDSSPQLPSFQADIEGVKILLVSHGFPPNEKGGTEQYTLALARALSGLGHQVFVFARTVRKEEKLQPRALSVTHEKQGEITITRVPLPPPLNPASFNFFSFRNRLLDDLFRRYLLDLQPQVVHFQHLVYLSSHFPMVAASLGIPVYVTLHDAYTFCSRLFMMQGDRFCEGAEVKKCVGCLNSSGQRLPLDLQEEMEGALLSRLGEMEQNLILCRKIFCPSQFLLEHSRRAFPSLNEKIQLLETGIEPFWSNGGKGEDSLMGTGDSLEGWQSNVPMSNGEDSVSERNPSRSSGEGQERQLKFACIGNIMPLKGTHLLFLAFSRLQERYPDLSLSLLLAGKIADAHYWESIQPLLKRAKNVTYTGEYRREDLPGLLTGVDLVVVPSLMESYSLVSQEAFSLGIPVLASRAGGIPSVVREREGGLLFTSGDEEDLLAKMSRLIEEPDLAGRLKGEITPPRSVLDMANELEREYQESRKESAISCKGMEPLPKVVAFSEVSGACWQIRIKDPLKTLASSGEIQYLGGCFLASPHGSLFQQTDHLEKIKEADIVIFQRIAGEYPLSLVRIAKLLGKVVLYDLDDDLDQIPEGHPGFSYYSNPELIRAREGICREVDAILVPSPLLQERIRKYNERVLLLPNRVNPDLMKSSKDEKEGGTIRIGYFGTRTHREDLDLLRRPLERILSEYDGRIEVVFLGEYLEEMKGKKRVSIIQEEREYPAFLQKLQDLHLDIGLAPLRETTFNEAKSPIKFLEYALCGTAVIASDVIPYREMIESGETGILCRNCPEEWCRSIKLLLDEPDLRERIGKNGQERVLSAHTVKRGVGEVAEIFATLLREKRESARISAHLVSIIIPTYNKCEYTRQCLEALFKNTPSPPPFEVIIVDNASRDDTLEVVKSFPVRVIANRENLGFSKGCNQGAKEAKGSYLLFLNNDTVPLRGWLSPLVAALQDNQAVAVAGSRLLYPGTGKIQHAGVIFSRSVVHPYPAPPVYHLYEGLPHDHPLVNKGRELQAVTGACLIIRKEVFWGAGGFDEGFQNGYEDVDLCLKVRRMGHRILYCPSSILLHHASVSPGRNDAFCHNGKRLLDRWSEFWEADDLKVYEEDGVTREIVRENGSIKEVRLFWNGVLLG